MRLRALSCAGAVVAALAPAPALGAWSAPAWVSARDGAAYSAPDVAASGGGRALAAFVRTPAGSAAGAARVQLATRTGARWTSPRVLSSRGGRLPKVALGARGDAVATWVVGRAIVAATRRGAAGPWRPARVVTAGGTVQDVRVAVDRAGRPVVLWSERRGGGFLVRIAARAGSRGRWSVRPARLATPGPAPPSLALSRAGALVAWSDGGRTRAARTAGGVFEAPVDVSSDGRGAPAVGIGGTGAGVAAWSVGLPGGTSVVLVRERGAGPGGWSPSEDAGIGAAPLAAINDRGDAVLAWTLGGAGTPQGVEASTRRAGRRWRASTVVAPHACACTLGVGSAAIDASGTAIVGWRRDEGRGVGGGGAAALAPGGDTWLRAPVRPGRTGASPATAAGARGGLVAWAEAGRGGGVRVSTLAPARP